MSDKNTGGFAFPSSANNDAKEGMTLRDYFAAKAMQGILAGDHPITHQNDCERKIALVAFDMADAMLSTRENS